MKTNSAIEKFFEDNLKGFDDALIRYSPIYEKTYIIYDTYSVNMIFPYGRHSYEMTLSFRFTENSVEWSMARNVMPHIGPDNVTPKQWSNVWDLIDKVLKTSLEYLSDKVIPYNEALKAYNNEVKDKAYRAKKSAEFVFSGLDLNERQFRLLSGWLSDFAKYEEKVFSLRQENYNVIRGLVTKGHIVNVRTGRYTFSDKIWEKINDNNI